MLRQIIGIAIATASLVNKFQHTSASAGIEFLPGKDWISLDNLTAGSCEYTEKAKNTDTGVQYEQKIKAEIPQGKLTNTMLHRLENRHLFVRLTYNTGEMQVIGCPDFPAKLTGTLNVKQNGSYKLEFTCNSIYRAFRL